jgi:hypothetical protein
VLSGYADEKLKDINAKDILARSILGNGGSE